jgi:hypothetical protein
MASLLSKLPRPDLCAEVSSEKPSPLRIVKRRSNLEGLLAAGRRTSGLSDGSASGPSDNDSAYLTITKRRLGRDYPQLTSSEAARLRRPSKSSEAQLTPVLIRDENVHPCQMFKASQTLNIGKTRTNRPNLNATLGRLPAPVPMLHSTTFTCASHRESMDRECPISYPQYERRVQQSTDPFLELPLLAEHDMNDHRARTQFVLCPHISVLCDTAAVQDGLQQIWAAIEVSGRLSKLSLRKSFGESTEGADIKPEIVTGSFVNNTLGVCSINKDSIRVRHLT